MDLDAELVILTEYATTYAGDTEADLIVTGALWALSRVSGEPVESLRSRMFTPVPVRGPRDRAHGIRLYSPPVGGVELVVTREAESLAVDSDAPVGVANPRSFSDLASEPEPLTEEDRAHLATLAEPSQEHIAAQVAALKARGNH